MNERIALVWMLVILGGIAGACQEEAPVESFAEAQTLLGADAVIMDGVHTMTNAQGIRTARLQFDTMYQWSDSTHRAVRGVNLVVFNEDGSERGQVTSIRGTFDPGDESLTANGNVVLVVPGEDRRLETEELHYDPEAQQLWSDSAFILYEGARTREGCSFTTDLEFQNFSVRGTAGAGGC